MGWFNTYNPPSVASPFYSAVASETLVYSDDAEISTTALDSATFVLGHLPSGASANIALAKAVTIPPHITNSASVIRIKFDHKYTGGNTQRVHLAKNGIVIGGHLDYTDAGYVTTVIDLTCRGGDVIQLYQNPITGAGTAYIKNFRLYCTVAVSAPAW